MKVIKPSVEILDKVNPQEILKKIEIAGRTCYKSEDRITEDSAEKFISMLIKRGHESVLEHEKITVRIVCDRGVTHELVRHRLASYSQESTRYCNYNSDKFENELTFIQPCFWEFGEMPDFKNIKIWHESMMMSERFYKELIQNGAKPEEARSVLPNSLKTEIVVTMNLRSWRHFIRLRTDKAAHPQIREIANMLKNKFCELIPKVFEY